MRFVLFRRRTLRGWRWFFHIKARNGEIVAQSEGYRNRADAAQTVELIRDMAARSVVEMVE